jgi:hypothetical protein
MHQFLLLSSVLASIAGLSSYSEPQNIEFRTAECRSVVSLCSVLLIKKTEYLTSTFDIHYSIFDIRFFRVSSTIRLAAFQAGGGAEP